MTGAAPMMLPRLPARVTIREVGPRDGLQNEAIIVSTADKCRLVETLSATGLMDIEVGAFVRAQNVPQMADTDAVFAHIQRRHGVTYSAIAPNVRGAQRAISARADDVQVFLSASESHNRSNVNMGIGQSLAAVADMSRLMHQAHKPLDAVISVAFGCPFEGDVPIQHVLDLTEHLLQLGIRRITYGDTTGMAYPSLVQQTVLAFRTRFPRHELRLHLHSARGAGLANIFAALQVGITEFDSSIGGIGGCPFAPGAPGNLCTEDLTHMLHEMGIQTGLDLPALLDCARLLEAILGHTVPGQTIKAGICKHLDTDRMHTNGQR